MKTDKLYTLKTVGKKRAMNLLMLIFKYIVVLAIAYVILNPIFIKLSVAIMSRTDMYDMSVNWIPKNPTLDNFKQILTFFNYGEYFKNTFMLSLFAALIQVATTALAGYAFARFEFKGKKLLFIIAIFMLIVPQQTYSTASYIQFKNFNFFGIVGLFGSDWNISLINTGWPLMILSFGCSALKNGLFIYIFRQFFKNLPDALEEAAWVDGAGVFKIFISVMLPNAIPAIVTVSVFAFVWTWNDLYAAQTYMPSLPVFSTFLSNLTSQLTTAFQGNTTVPDTYAVSTLANSGALLIIAPLIIFFFLAQRYFVEGIERTGLTGM